MHSAFVICKLKKSAWGGHNDSSFGTGASCRGARRGVSDRGARDGARSGFGPKQRPDQDRLFARAHRPARAEREAGAAWRQNLAGRNQRQRRAARPQGRTCQLRRPVQPGEHSRHLHQAARHRQSRSGERSLRHQSGSAGDSGRDAEGQGPDRPVRARRQQGVPLRPLLLDDFGRSQSEPVVHRRLLRVGGSAETEAADRRAGRRGRRVRAQRLRRRAGEQQDLRVHTSSTTRPSRPAPPISRRSSARCRPPMPIWSLSVPIR